MTRPLDHSRLTVGERMLEINAPLVPGRNVFADAFRDGEFVGQPLSQRIYQGIRQTLAGHGIQLERQDYIGHVAIARTVQDIVQGVAKRKVFVSPMPTGAGKTTALKESVMAIVNDPALSHIGIVIFLKRLAEVEALIRELNLPPAKFVVRTGKENIDLNNMGRTGQCDTKKCRERVHRKAQVLFVTQDKLQHLIANGSKSYQSMPFFDYCGEGYEGDKSCGRPRQLIFWDETYLPIDPVTLTLDEVRAFAGKLLVNGQSDAANMLISWIEQQLSLRPQWKRFPKWDLGIKLSDVPELFDKLEESGERNKVIAAAMFYLRGREVRLEYQDYDKQTVTISYRRTLPYDMEPMIVFDASASQKSLYHLMEKKGGYQIEQLPTVKKTYKNLTIRFHERAAGTVAYSSKANLDQFAEIAADAFLAKPKGQSVLFVIRKGKKAPATTLRALIETRIKERGGDPGLARFITWGTHTATNEFSDVPHIVVIGLYQMPLKEIVGMVYGTSSKPMSAELNPNELELARMGEMRHHLFQAIGRGQTRNMRNGDVPEGSTVDIISSGWGPMGFKNPLDTLSDMFPGATVLPWHPKAGLAQPTESETVTIHQLEQMLADAPSLATNKGQIADRTGYSEKTIQRRLNDPLFLHQLIERGIDIERTKEGYLVKRGTDPV